VLHYLVENSKIITKLQSVSDCNDTNKFADLILSLSPKEIISLSFDEVFEISQLISLHSFEQFLELFDYLRLAGDFANEKMMADIDVSKNASLARFFYFCTNSIQSKHGVPDCLTLNSTATALFKLAQLGIEENKNILESIRLCEQIQKMSPESNPNHAGSWINEANARMHLAGKDIESEKNLKLAIGLYEKTRNVFPQNSEPYLGSLSNEADARIELAKQGINPEDNCLKALSYVEIIHTILPESNTEYCHILFTETDARNFLADNGVETEKNLNASIDLFKKIRTIVHSNSIFYAKSLVNEGCARSKLAKIVDNTKEHQEKAIEMFQEARKIFRKNSIDFAISLRCEAMARTDLVVFGENDEENLNQALKLFKKSRQIFPISSLDYASTLLGEANTKKALADQGIKSEDNYNAAIDLIKQFQQNYSLPPLQLGTALMNEGTFRADLGIIGINVDFNREISLNLFEKSIEIFEKNNNGFDYSIAMIKAINASIMGYFDTGDTKYLDHGTALISKAIFEFGSHKIFLKQTVQARLHELKATIYEYGKPVRLGEAAHEYFEAFNLSNDEYYKFMDEFCRTRNGENKFCEFVQRWKEREKVNRHKSDFMEEYFGYALFECHVEKALQSSIYEEQELKNAIKTLEGIRDSTPSALLKERFDAYISIIRAVYLCLVEKNYPDAKNSVKSACKIFSKYNERAGIEICEVFHDAINSGNDPEAWRKAMSRCQPLTGNIATLIYRYSDKRELNLRNQLYSNDIRSLKEIVIKNNCENQNRFSKLEENIYRRLDSTDVKIQSIHEKIGTIFNSLNARFDELEKIYDRIPEKYVCQLKQLQNHLEQCINTGDTKSLEKIIQKITKDKQTLIKSIQKLKISDEEKRKMIDNIESLDQIQPKINEKLTEFGSDISKDLIASLTAAIILEHLVPIIIPAVSHGPQIIGIILEIIKNWFI